MIGEIRDRDTLDVAIKAALTGHLVFSTVHTRDAAGAITRLVELGVERFLLSSVLRGVLAQRLIRKVCPRCAVDGYLTPDQVAAVDESYTGQFLRRALGPAPARQAHHGARRPRRTRRKVA